MTDLTRAHRRLRRGSAYVFVLGVASMVTLLGLSALTVARLGTVGDQDSHDWHDAQTLAALGIDHALETLDGYDDQVPATWRNTWTTRGAAGEGMLDGGTFSWQLADADGAADLLSNTTGDILLTSTGVKGDAKHVMSVHLTPGPGSAVPMPCLGMAMHAGDDISIQSTTLASDGIVSANGRVSTSEATVNANVSAAESILGSGYAGTTTSGANVLDMPDTALFDYYETHGTVIDFSALDSTGLWTRALRAKLLSPTENPFGDPNPYGIYIIDCQWQTLQIYGCRIVGTLVIRNASDWSEISRNMNWEPAFPDYPALLVDGSMRFDLWSTPLVEHDPVDTALVGHIHETLNPDSTPYDGVSDNDDNDEYPSVIGGIIYASRDLTIEGGQFEGTLIAGDDITVKDGLVTVLHRYDAATFAYGFTTQLKDGYPTIVDGSWRQIVAAPTD